jgi:hypothetical protein
MGEHIEAPAEELGAGYVNRCTRQLVAQQMAPQAGDLFFRKQAPEIVSY